MRGFFKIGIYQPKTADNVGTLIRSAYSFGASEVFVIGERYTKQPSAVKLERHIPVVSYANITDFTKALPTDIEIVCIEMSGRAGMLVDFKHPDRTVYILGSEDDGLPGFIVDGEKIVQIEGDYCLNVATAGSIVMWDRVQKRIRGTK